MRKLSNVLIAISIAAILVGGMTIDSEGIVWPYIALSGGIVLGLGAYGLRRL